jgi:sugar lactone lactonase YvrE
MRFFGHSRLTTFGRLPAVKPALLGLLLAAPLFVCPSPALQAQTAPYVLPYTVTTFAGPHALYSAVGQPCTNTNTYPANNSSLPASIQSSLYALDTTGDGCLISQIVISGDPHDIRVDGHGNIFFINNPSTSSGVVHRINPFTRQLTIEAGNLVGLKPCSTGTGDAYGDGCTANDGAANSNPNVPSSTTHNAYTTIFKEIRGLGMGPNGDVLIPGYNDYYVHRIAASSLYNGSIQYNFMQTVMGNGAGSSTQGVPSEGPVNSNVGQTRGATEDVFGNVYVADTTNYLIRQESGGVVSALTLPGTTGSAYVSGGLASSTKIGQPDDIELDSYGNIYFVDDTNKLLVAIYKAGTLPGISSPVVGHIYTIAGNGGATNPAATTTPVNGLYPTVPATSVAITMRKISLDSLNNIYITDYSENVVWFLDHATGNIRILAGNYGATTPSAGCPTISLDTLGDGCPGAYAAFSLNDTSTYNDVGVGSSSDGQGNLYITDPEAGVTNGGRIRKIVSGLNFQSRTTGGPVTTGTAVTNNIDLHFAPGDTPAATAYALTTNGDYVLGTATCTVNADTTDDCILPVTFTPTVTGEDNAILKVTSTLGGVANFQLTGQGTAAAIAFDPGNTASLAAISNSQGIALDGAGNAYIADTGSNRVLFYNATTKTTTAFAGGGSAACAGATDTFGDGCLATATALNAPTAVAIDTFGNLYIADTGNNIIRKVSASGIITLYGGGAANVCAAVTQYTPGSTDTIGDGCLATQATFSKPSGLATDYLGNLYIADTGNNLVRQISNTGFVTVLAGGGTVCTSATDSNGDGCPATQTLFNAPTGMVYDPFGQNIVVADTGNSIVRKIYLGNTFNTSSAGLASNIQSNPVSLIAGNGQSGSSVDSNNVAVNSQLSRPTGVAIDASGTVYIADSGNHAVRMVTTGGKVLTIAGILGASGTGTVPASAILTQLASPSSVAVLPTGTLYIADSGNNRLLSDVRAQIAYNFGRTNDGFPSPLQNFTAVNIGTSAATLPSVPLFTETPADSQLTLVAAANSNGSVTACASGGFASGAICNLQGQFNPTDTNAHSAAFAFNASNGGLGIAAAAPAPAITLQGQGAVLTTTTSSVSQTSPATGNAQFGAPLTLTATVSAIPNTADPVAYPMGNIIFIVDGTAGQSVMVAPGTVTANSTSATASTPSNSSQTTGLSVGTHTISCQYNGDFYYAGSVCQPTNKTITIAQASTTSVLTYTNNNQPQFTPVTLTATVTSNTIGTPTSPGSVTFLATPSGSTTATPIGSANLNGSGVAFITLGITLDANGNTVANTTLLPGTYTLSCQYNNTGNFAGSACAGVQFTVLPQPQALSLSVRGCVSSSLYAQGTNTTVPSATCPSPLFTNGVPTVATADGSTTDATIFITPTNTVSGTITFSCSGLPAHSACTFQPTSIPLTAGTAYAAPVFTDVTFFTDVQPGNVSALARPNSGIALATVVGWPLTAFSLIALLVLRRRKSLRGLSLLAVFVLMAGTALTFGGCAGPGSYTPALTPASPTGQPYPITITVKGPGISTSTIVDFAVTAPGITGQQ